MTVVYYEEDADIEFLRDKLIGVIGYGSLGRPIALNLQDSGLKIMVGQRPEESTAISKLMGLITIESKRLPVLRQSF